MKPKVKIVEIGPRDGFQNVKEFIPTNIKIETIEDIISSGISKVQITSFVHKKAIPQMEDADRVASAIIKRYEDIELFALIPNYYGGKRAVEVGFLEVTPVISLSQSHNMANVKRTHEQSLEEFKNIISEFPKLKLTVDIATAFGCPFEGEIPIEKLLELMKKLYGIGIRAFTLCDTIGVAYPKQIRDTVETIRKTFLDIELNIHIHDTRNMGIINSYTAIYEGVDSVQTALGGLGGCPFAPGATGNTATEDLVYLLWRDGIDTGIDVEKLLHAARKLHKRVGGNYSGHHINIEKNACGLKQD